MSTTHFNLSIGRSVDSGGNRKHFEEILSWTFISFGCFLLLLLTWEGASFSIQNKLSSFFISHNTLQPAMEVSKVKCSNCEPKNVYCLLVHLAIFVVFKS